jgi:lipoprotein signal peptidase
MTAETTYDPERAAHAGTTPSLFAGKALFWLPIPVLVGLDLWSKAAVFDYLATTYSGARLERVAHTVFDGPVRLDLVAWHNTGTIWGLAQDYNGPLTWLRCAALVIIVLMAYRTRPRARAMLLVLSALMAGALGNLYDNFTEPGGGVRDFLYFTFKFVGGPEGWGFPAFNVADACITVGAVTLAVLIAFGERRDPRAARAAAAAGSS